MSVCTYSTSNLLRGPRSIYVKSLQPVNIFPGYRINSWHGSYRLPFIIMFSLAQIIHFRQCLLWIHILLLASRTLNPPEFSPSLANTDSFTVSSFSAQLIMDDVFLESVSALSLLVLRS